MIENEDDETFQVRAKKDIKANENVFLIDHAYSFRYRDLRNILLSNEPALTRLQNILKFHEKKKKLP